jgi:hypothetical protein
MSIRVGYSPQTRSFAPAAISLAFGFGTFAYAKDQASLPPDGLLKEYPTPCSQFWQEEFFLRVVPSDSHASAPNNLNDPIIIDYPHLW